MSGITDLRLLLDSLEPELDPEPWVYAVVDQCPDGLEPFATVREAEGLTVVVMASEAQHHGLEASPRQARITLTVHSSLEAVGMTAAFARALADRGLSCNVVAGYHHDHLLVPWDRRDEAVAALRAITTS